MKKALSCLFLALGLAFVALPAEAFSADYGFCGSVPVDCVTKKGWCSMTPSSTLSFPYGSVAVNPCTTSTVASTAIGTTSQVAGTVVLRCPDGKICSADLPSSSGGDTYKVQCTAGDTTQGYLHDKLEGDGTISVTTITSEDGSQKERISCTVPGDNYTVKSTSGDASSGYLHNKLSAGSGISIATSTGGGGVQTETISATAVSDTYKLMCSVTDAVPDYLHSKIAAGEGIYTTKITDTETGKEAVQISSSGGVAAVGSDIPDVLYNRLVVNGDGLNETVVGSGRTHQVQVGLTNPRKTDVAYVFGFGTSVGSCLIDATTWDNPSAGVWQTKTNQSIIGTACIESGVVPAVSDRILVASPGSGSPAYGIYTITSTGSASTKAVITRASDASAASQFAQGMEILIRRGHLYGGARAVLLTAGPYTVDTTALTFGIYGGLQATNFSGSANVAQVTEGDLYLTNNTGWDVSQYQHGFAPILPMDSSKFLNGTGGWSTPAGGGGSSFTTIYELDFAAQANQTITADGNYTIDSRTWRALNKGNSQTFAVQNGNGLYIRDSTASTNNENGTLNCPMLYIRFPDIAVGSLEFSNWSEVIIWGMMTQPHTPNANSERILFGLIVGDSVSPGSIYRYEVGRWYGSWFGSPYIINGQLMANLKGGTTGYQGGLVSSTVYDVFALRIKGALIDAYFGQSSGGSWPSLSSMKSNSRGILGNTGGAVLGGTSDVLIASFQVCSGNGAGNSDMLVTKFRVQTK